MGRFCGGSTLVLFKKRRESFVYLPISFIYACTESYNYIDNLHIKDSLYSTLSSHANHLPKNPLYCTMISMSPSTVLFKKFYLWILPKLLQSWERVIFLSTRHELPCHVVLPQRHYTVFFFEIFPKSSTFRVTSHPFSIMS